MDGLWKLTVVSSVLLVQLTVSEIYPLAYVLYHTEKNIHSLSTLL